MRWRILTIVIYFALLGSFIVQQKWTFEEENSIVSIDMDTMQKLTNEELLLYIESKDCSDCLPVNYTKRLLDFHDKILFRIPASSLQRDGDDDMPTLIYYKEGVIQYYLVGELSEEVIEQAITHL